MVHFRFIILSGLKSSLSPILGSFVNSFTEIESVHGFVTGMKGDVLYGEDAIKRIFSKLWP